MNTDVIPSIPATLWVRRGKRVADMLCGGLLLLLCSPLMLVAAAFIKASSPGPVFFRQTRGGKNGKPFVVIKFRTMRAGRTPDPKELVPLDHAEITGVGRLLRRLKIDELPQLFNVLSGDMSVVGPRPTLLDQIAEYDSFRRQRLLVKPGLTGLAQVYSSATASWDERISYDIAYVRLCSPLLDISILLRTVLVVFLGENRTARDFASTRFARSVNRAA
jgi:lipopolysaccharide/colanic/teichoic acid biosynthesis glycosyltransferase